MQKKLGFTHDDKHNATQVWVTPRWIFDALQLQFDLDPCTEQGGIPWIPAAKVFCEADNGLAQDWDGLIWLNPPYGPDTSKWLAKMHTHRNGIALVFARTDTQWFHDYVAKADAILFLQGRIKFVDWNNATKSSGAGAGSMLIAWGKQSVEAIRKMRSIGFFTQGDSDDSEQRA